MTCRCWMWRSTSRPAMVTMPPTRSVRRIGAWPAGSGARVGAKTISRAKLADVGAQMGGSFDGPRRGIAAHTLSSAAERDAALDIMARGVAAPLFPETVLARERESDRHPERAETKPEHCGKGLRQGGIRAHPYAWSEEIADVERYQRADLESFYRAAITAQKTL